MDYRAYQRHLVGSTYAANVAVTVREARMHNGNGNGYSEPGWLDVAEYLAHLRGATGRSWCVCVATTGELSKERSILLSVCEFRAGAPIVRDDLALSAACWPNYGKRGLASTVHDLLYRFDRRLEERAQGSAQQAAF